MASFNSPLGSKNSGNQQPLKQFVVPDESGYHSQTFDASALQEFQDRMNPPEQNLEEEFRAARQEKLSGRQRMSPGAKQRIEALLGMIKNEKEVILVDNLSFILQTLKAEEQTQVFKEAARNVLQIEYDFELRRQTLARSIKSVSGVLLSDFIGSEDVNNKLYFVDQLDDLASNKLFIEYGKLTNEVQEKYGMKTPQQQKEVAEELKK